MSSAQDGSWKARAQASEAQYIHQKEQEKLSAIKAKLDAESTASSDAPIPREDRPYEAGFGGQEDLEDRYATTSGDH